MTLFFSRIHSRKYVDLEDGIEGTNEIQNERLGGAHAHKE